MKPTVSRLFAAFALTAALAAGTAMAQGDKKPATPAPVTPQPAAPATPTPAPAQPAKPIPATPPAATTPPPAKPAAEESPVYVSMKTSMGDMVLELNPAKAPISVENFLKYADKGYYDGTIFHRVIAGFMIQGGGFTADGKKKETEKGIKNEWKNGLKNTKGTVAMARVGGDPNSGTSQFFINTVDNPFLDQPQPDGAAYAVFGRVVSGMEVVDKIRAVKVSRGALSEAVPAETITIEKVKRLTDDEAAKYKKAGDSKDSAPPKTDTKGDKK
jgi:peptidyl-prolyl cis-trans isomerase A (cyclophilin A)